MPVTSLTSREFNQDTGRAKRATAEGPVYITDRGTPAHVLLSFEEFQRLQGNEESIVEMLAMPVIAGVDADEIEFEVPRLARLIRPVDLG